MSELARDLAAAEQRASELRAAMERGGKTCPPGTCERRCRQSIAAVSGFDSFRKRVKKISGHDLVHPGYTVWECIACGQWTLDDYCGEPNNLIITAEAARELM